MTRGFHLGRVSGIDIEIDWSLAIIFALIVVSLGSGLFPAWHPDWSPLQAWTVALVAAVIFLASVLAHELSHALMGRRYGIEIRRITLFMFGGMAHLTDEPQEWKAELWMALVGPLASMAIGLGCLWLAGLLTGPVTFDPQDPQALLRQLGATASLLLWLGQINLLLALFNLVPGYPLDGGRVLRAALWGMTGNPDLATRWASRAGQAFAWLLMSAGLAMMLGVTLPVLGGGAVSGLWLAFIGWFLNNAAVVGYRQTRARSALEGLDVSRLMLRQVPRVPPGMTIETLIDTQLMASGQRTFAVESDGSLLGLVSLSDLRHRPRSKWAQTTIAQVMTPRSRLTCTTPATPASEALYLLAGRDLNQLPVLENDQLVGLFRREDVLRWLSLGGVWERSPDREG